MAGDKHPPSTTTKPSSHSPHGAHQEVPPDELAKYYARACTQRFDEYPRYPSTYSGGVIPMYINSRQHHERERLGPNFTDADRDFRVQYIKDQELHPSEPFQVKQLYYEYNNIFKRIVRAPFNLVEQHLMIPFFRGNKKQASIYRRTLGRFTQAYIISVLAWYWFKYHKGNWESPNGPDIFVGREPVYPKETKRFHIRSEPWEHHDRYFSKRSAFRGDYETSTPFVTSNPDPPFFK